MAVASYQFKRAQLPIIALLFLLWMSASEAAQTHWAFIPPTRENHRGIDWFIKQQLTENGIKFSKEADRFTLARRVALVLTGLPLEPERAKKFAADNDPKAYEQLIDELLASERFGEHQAKYWLDAVRYADTHGLHMDNRRAIFPYRDWVIRAFNKNLPFNFFLKWQIAGDLFSVGSGDRMIATGFIRLNPTTGEDGSLYEEYQAVNTFDRVETFGTALLGMTLSCARCHDHKYDPISQEDYFRLFAYFNNTSEPSLDDNAYRYDPVIMTPKDPTQREAWTKALPKRTVSPSLSMLATPVKPPVKPEWAHSDWKLSRTVDVAKPKPDEERFFSIKDLPGKSFEKLPDTGDKARWVSFSLRLERNRVIWLRYGSGPGHQLFVDGVRQTNTSRFLPLNLKQGPHTVAIKLTGSADRDPLEVRLTDSGSIQLKSKRLADDEQGDLRLIAQIANTAAIEDRFVPTMVAAELESPRITRVLKRGQYDRPIGKPLLPGIPPAFGKTAMDLPTNRLGLAQWLIDRDNPLVARVLANRMWQQVFGAGLARTPEDFGTRGEPPTHPELLDWLAVEFMDTGWNMKRTLKTILLSRTFRQQSTWRKDIDDPENHLWARGPRYRLDAEVIRDIGLWAGGILDLKMGGEGVKPWQPPGLWKALAHPDSNTRVYEPDEDAVSYRRSIYLYWKRSSPHPMMTLFDAPNREASCVRRSRSNTAAQSLALLNERHRIQMAQAIAKRIASQSDDFRIRELYWLLAGREPRDSERKVCASLLDQLEGDKTDAWPKLVIAVMASDAAITLN